MTDHKSSADMDRPLTPAEQREALADWLEQAPTDLIAFGTGAKDVVRPDYLLASDVDWIIEQCRGRDHTDAAAGAINPAEVIEHELRAWLSDYMDKLPTTGKISRRLASVVSPDAARSSAGRASAVTDEMVERAWAAMVGADIAGICFNSSVIRADIRTALEAVFTTPARGSAEPLSALAGLFSESAHETWTKDEIVNIIEDAIRMGSAPSSTEGKSHD